MFSLETQSRYLWKAKARSYLAMQKYLKYESSCLARGQPNIQHE